MKTAVITGSTRGLGFEMARKFRMNGVNVVINGLNEKRLEESVSKLRAIPSEAGVEGFAGNAASPDDLRGLLDYAVSKFGSVDIWINNAGVRERACRARKQGEGGETVSGDYVYGFYSAVSRRQGEDRPA